MKKVKVIGSMLFLAVFLAATMSPPAFAEDKEMAEIYKGIQKDNAAAVSGAVDKTDKTVKKAVEPEKPKCNIMGLMKEEDVVKVSKKARNDTASCDELASVEALLPKHHCKADNPSLKHFANAKARLKCGQEVAEADKPDDVEKKAKTSKSDDSKKADTGKKEKPEKVAPLDLSKPLVKDGEKLLESAKKFLAYFKQALADCEADLPNIEESKSSAKADMDDLDMTSETKEEILDSFASAIGSLTPLVTRCIEEKGVRIADMEMFIVNLENMPAGQQFEWEHLDVANLNPDLVNGENVFRGKTNDGKEFEGKVTLVGKNLVLGEGEKAKLIPVANLAEIYLRKDVETGGNDGSLAFYDDYHGIGDSQYAIKDRPDALKGRTLQLSFLWLGFSGNDTFSFNNVDYKRNFRGSSPCIELALRSEWAFHKRFSFVYVGGIFIGWRDVNETNQTQIDGKYIRNSGGMDGGPVVEVGLGFNDWVEVVAKVRGHLSPGYIAPGVGVNLTFIRGLRVGLEYVHGLDVFGTDYVPGPTFGISIGVAL